ncbi:MAG: hypothetical protein IJ420_05120 [Lachnospiraceae bacterium]|nr:hypothetical protein [Lachnospiraceae bacterium]MBQ8632965.1 hypothetical protein [Lachnospiraceae bacterium]
MKVIDVYKQYFAADCMFNTVQRNGVVVTLTATSDCGMIKYEVGLSFFPHNDAEDFGISYDAYVSKEIYNAKGRRSKKKEAVFMEQLRENADAAAEEIFGKIFWDKPLREAQYG